MFKLIAIIVETGVVLGIAYLMLGIFNFLFRRERIQLLPKGHNRIFALFIWLILVMLKLNLFWLDEGGIEYRRIPLCYSYEIRETEIGTYLLKNGSEVGLPAIDECDISSFFLQNGKMIFQCASSGKIKVFSFVNAMLTETPVKEDTAWTTFDKEFRIYHYLKADSILILALTLLYAGLMFYSSRHNKK